MDLKPYIAILFAVVFFGKFLVMDSKILVVLLDADEIAYVNPFCKKQNAKLQTESQESFSEDADTFNFSIDSFCNTPFKFELFTWESEIISEAGPAYADYTPSLPQSAQDRFYPPPQA